ncbi:amidohydrolase [Mangrovimicrobium sediminis]|uniref:Amidohydrolase n=1 Tax=Mangrovimicrobium sediminis TaxID=2562682 RepID=A0A4Z0M5E6_9GAMM|nr:amidohydrolase family protein [Haliea sp. SAOS-164]TGD74640.1 amidohydrolase [Haliea sp. SAOS-164]
MRNFRFAFLSLALLLPAPLAAAKPVTLVEGTNLAVAVDPASGVAVLALQGRLYRQAPGEVAAMPITGWLDDAWEPDFAPDGSAVVFKGYGEESFDLYRVRVDGKGGIERLTDSLFDDREPLYSPDGAAVLFSSDRSGNYDVWRLSLAEGALTQLTDAPGDEFSPALSPDGENLAWIAAEGREQVILTRAIAGDAPVEAYRSASKLSGLRWLPDGSALSFRSLDRDPAGNATSSLRRLDLASGADSVLSPAGADVFPFRATWLDAQTAVYTSDGVVKVWREGQALAERPFSVSFDIPAREYAHRERDFDAADERQVLGISTPALSPSGDVVAFTALGDLWLWNPDKQDLQQLTDDAAADQMPSWSDDGKQLAWVSDRGGEYRIYLQDLASGERIALPVSQRSISFPSWSPDGRRFAFFTDVPDNPLLHVVGQLMVFDRDSGKLEKYSQPMPPQSIAWSADGSKLLTLRLKPYSRRYREGLYVLAVIDLQAGTTTDIVPVPHRSIAHVSYSAKAGGVAFEQDGVLYRMPLTAQFEPDGPVELLHAGLADSPHWSKGGEQLVFQAGDRLQRMTVATGELEDITPPLSWQRDVPQDEWVLRAGRVFDGRALEYRENVDIHVRGQRIVELLPMGARDDLPVVDASDKVVIPGLFESHAHIGDHNHSESQGRAFLAYGVTSIRDPGSNPYLANERKEAWTSGRRVGPRTFITGHNIDGRRAFYAVVEAVSSDAHLERALQRAELLELDFLKTYVRLPDRQQQRVTEFGHATGIPVTSHELLPAAIYGVDAIEHFTGTSRRGYTTKISELGRSYQDVVEVITTADMGIVPTMVVPGVVLTFSEQDDIYSTPQFNNFYGPSMKQTYQDFMAFFGPGAEGYVDAYGELLTKLIERDALVGTGTDSPFTPFGTGLHAELRLYQREGIAPAKILLAATYQSARIAGAERDLGSIEPGKLADMVVIDGDPLADISDSDNIVLTVKNGRRYTQDELFEYRDSWR